MRVFFRKKQTTERFAFPRVKLQAQERICKPNIAKPLVCRNPQKLLKRYQFVYNAFARFQLRLLCIAAIVRNKIVCPIYYSVAGLRRAPFLPIVADKARFFQ